MTYMLWKKGKVTPEYTIFADRFAVVALLYPHKIAQDIWIEID